MRIKPSRIECIEHKFAFEITNVKANTQESITGEMSGTGAEQVILALLEQYPDCKGTIKRIYA